MPTAKAVGISACRKSLVFDVLLLYHSALTMIMATDVLFVGQHFSGSLFEWVHLSI